MKKYIITLIMVFGSLSAFGDEPEKPEDPLKAEGSLTGNVNDAQTKKPVEYATIGVYRMSDSSLVTGTITNTEGLFDLSDIPYGDYYVDIRFVGYQDTRITKIKIDKEQPLVKLGGVDINQMSTSLEAVEVVAEQKAFEYKIDKKIVNVSQNISSAGGTAVDVLENTPSIQTDIDGNVSLRGSSNFTVLIDGKPSVLEGNDALQQIPASSIQKIEIITNPSAKYNPEGTAGIINLIMKRQDLKGWNGIVNGSAGTQGELSGDILMNFRTGKFNFFGGINLSDRPSPGSGFSENETYGTDTTFYLFSDGDRAWRRGGGAVKGGFDYYLNEKNTFSLSGKAGKRIFGMSSLNRYHQYTLPASEESFYIQDNLFDVDIKYYSADMNYRRTFGKAGQELNVYAYYGLNDGGTRQEVFQEFTNELYVAEESGTGRNRSAQDFAISDLRFKLDYTHPFTEKSRLETGFQSMLTGGDGLYAVEDFDPDLMVWQVRDEQTSSMEYSRDIQSIYAMFYGSAGSLFDFQVGLRTEYTNRTIQELISDQEYRIDRWDFYPSIFISRKFKGDHQLQASFSRRVRRPRSWQLNPVQNYIDPLNVRIGNPALKPEFINSYELNYQKQFGKHSFTTEVYLRETYDKITRIREVRDDNILFQTFENLNRDQALGMEMMGNFKLMKWWDLMLSTNVYHYSITRYEREGDEIETYTYNLRGNSTFNLKWGTRIQLTGIYNGPSVDAQGTRKGYFMTNVGIRQDFFNRKLNVTFKINDLFGTARFINTSEGQNFYIYSEFKRKAPTFGISLSYRINNFKQEKNSGMNEMEFTGY